MSTPPEDDVDIDLKRKPRVPDVPLEGGPYAMGSDHWEGLAKLIEEAGEVVQVAGKLIGTGGDTHHWDGSDLKVRLEEEIADVVAAARYVVAKNGLDEVAIQRRVDKKLQLFLAWSNRVKR